MRSWRSNQRATSCKSKIICLVKRRRTKILYLVQIDIIAMLMLMQYCIGQVYRILHLIIIIHPFINVILIRPRLHLCQTALSPDSEKAIGYAPLQISLLKKEYLRGLAATKLIQQTITHLIPFYGQKKWFFKRSF